MFAGGGGSSVDFSVVLWYLLVSRLNFNCLIQTFFFVLQGGTLEPHQETVERFLSTLDKMGLPGFKVSDLEQVLLCYTHIILLEFCNATWLGEIEEMVLITNMDIDRKLGIVLEGLNKLFPVGQVTVTLLN